MHALAAPIPAPPVVEVCWFGVVPVDVLAAAPPVVAVLPAAPVPVPAPPVVLVPAAPVFPLAPTDEPPVVETLPPAAGGVPELDPDADEADEADVDVDVDAVDVRVEVEAAAGGVAFPVVGTVNVGTSPVLTVPDPPPLPHDASVSEAASTPAAAMAVRMAGRRTSMTSQL